MKSRFGSVSAGEHWRGDYRSRLKFSGLLEDLRLHLARRYLSDGDGRFGDSCCWATRRSALFRGHLGAGRARPSTHVLPCGLSSEHTSGSKATPRARISYCSHFTHPRAEAAYLVIKQATIAGTAIAVDPKDAALRYGRISSIRVPEVSGSICPCVPRSRLLAECDIAYPLPYVSQIKKL